MKILLLILGIALGSVVQARQWPSRPLRYIVPFPPGAFNDALARTPAAALPRTLRDTPNVLPHVRAGKLEALAVSTKARALLAPEVPTVDEAGGVPGYDVSV